MTLQEKAREWSHKEVSGFGNFTKNMLAPIFERAYLAGAAKALEWVPVSEYAGDIREIEGINHFLIPIVDASGDFTEWNIVTGTPEDDTICGIDGIYHEVDVSQASHYMPVAIFPPHPEK